MKNGGKSLVGHMLEWFCWDEPLDLEDYLPADREQVFANVASIDDLVEEIGRLRGRPIRMIPWEMPPDSYGARAAGKNVDYIIYERNTAAVHQEHIKAHELGHILANHDIVPIGEAEEDLVATLMRASERNGYTEREAESLAEALQNEIIRRVGLQALTKQVSTSPAWSDIARGLAID